MSECERRTDAPMRVLVLSDLAEATALLVEVFGKAGMEVSASPVAGGAGVEAVKRELPDVVVVADTEAPLAPVVEALDSAAPSVPSLVVVADAETAQQCVLAGARATLLKPITQADLLDAVQVVYAKEQRRRQYTVSQAAGVEPQRPRVIAVHGAKGGVGTTTLACNLAAAVTRVTQRRVALVDGDVLSSDVGVLLNLVSNRNICDVLANIENLDDKMIGSLLPQHSSQMRVLLAPEQMQHAEAIGGAELDRTLRALTEHFDYLVVDTPSHMSPVTLAALDLADLILLVVTPEIVAMRQTARFLQLTGQLGYPADKVLVVANRANTGNDITTSVVEEHLGRVVTASLPSDGSALVDCLNRGELIVATRPRSPVSDGVFRLARWIAARYETSAPKNLAPAAHERRRSRAGEDGRAGEHAGRRGWRDWVFGRLGDALPAGGTAPASGRV